VRTSTDLVSWTPLTQLFLATTRGEQSFTLDTSSAPALFVHVQIAP
jgi:hypothetical protein